MKIDISLKEAVDALDLSSWENRFGATALAIVLLKRIWNAESCVGNNLLSYYDRLMCDYYTFGICEGEDNLHAISNATSILYHTYGLHKYRRLGIDNYLNEIDRI